MSTSGTALGVLPLLQHSLQNSAGHWDGVRFKMRLCFTAIAVGILSGARRPLLQVKRQLKLAIITNDTEYIPAK